MCITFRFYFLAWCKMILALYVPWSQLLSTYLFCFLLFRQRIIKKRFGNPGKWSSHLSFIWFSSVHSLSQVWLFVIPWISAHQVSLSITNSWGLLKLMAIDWWCHPTISSSIIPFSSCLQSFPATESFTMSQFFISGGQSIGVSASASVLPMNIQNWFPLGWTGLISLQSKRLSRVFSKPIPQF